MAMNLINREIELRINLDNPYICDIFQISNNNEPDKKLGYFLYLGDNDNNPSLYLINDDDFLSLFELSLLVDCFKSSEEKELDVMSENIKTVLDNGLSPIETNKIFLLAECSIDEIPHQLQLRLTRDPKTFMSVDEPEESNLILLA